MTTDFDEYLAHFKTRTIFLNYGTLGSLRDWMQQVWNESEERSNRFRDINDLPPSLDEYMRPRRIGDSVDGRFVEIQKDFACVLAMVKKFGESKRVSEI